MIGSVSSNETEIAIGALTVTKDRRDAVQFTMPFISSTYAIMIHEPASRAEVEIESQEWAFIQPFENVLWFWIGITLMVVSVVMMGIDRLSPYGHHGTGELKLVPEVLFSNFNS